MALDGVHPSRGDSAAGDWIRFHASAVVGDGLALRVRFHLPGLLLLRLVSSCRRFRCNGQTVPRVDGRDSQGRVGQFFVRKLLLCLVVDFVSDSRSDSIAPCWRSETDRYLRLQLLPPSCLPAEKKGLGVLALAADFERSKILVPLAFGSFGLRLTPELQAIQIVRRNLSLSQPFEEMIAQRGRKIGPLDFRHLFPENQAR